MENILDIDKIIINIPFIKNQRDGNVNDNTIFTIAINIFPIVVNTKKNIIELNPKSWTVYK